MKITVEQIMSWAPYEDYLNEDRVRKLIGDGITREQVFDLPIPVDDRLWVLLHEEVTPAPILHEFACRVAEHALTQIPNPDPRSVAAIETKRRWLRGEATNEELIAASDAAGAAAWAIARGATRAAARAAAWAAAGDAARSAKWSSKRAAEWAAEWAAARASKRVAEWAAECDVKWATKCDVKWAAAGAAAWVAGDVRDAACDAKWAAERASELAEKWASELAEMDARDIARDIACDIARDIAWAAHLEILRKLLEEQI